MNCTNLYHAGNSALLRSCADASMMFCYKQAIPAELMAYYKFPQHQVGTEFGCYYIIGRL